MEWKTTFILLQIYVIQAYYFFILFQLPKIANFCTRPNWHPIVNLLTVNLVIFLAGFPVYFLDKTNTTHYAFAILACIIFLLNYIFLLFISKERFEASMMKEDWNGGLSEVNTSGKNIYVFIKNLNHKVFGKDYLSHKDALLVVIFMFPYLDLFTKNPISLFLSHIGFIASAIVTIFLIIQAGKIASPEDFK